MVRTVVYPNGHLPGAPLYRYLGPRGRKRAGSLPNEASTLHKPDACPRCRMMLKTTSGSSFKCSQSQRRPERLCTEAPSICTSKIQSSAPRSSPQGIHSAGSASDEEEVEEEEERIHEVHDVTHIQLLEQADNPAMPQQHITCESQGPAMFLRLPRLHFFFFPNFRRGEGRKILHCFGQGRPPKTTVLKHSVRSLSPLRSPL